MKKVLFSLYLFLGCFVAGSAQEKLPTVFISHPPEMDNFFCAQAQLGQKNANSAVESYIKDLRNKYRNVFSATSFRLTGFSIWHRLYMLGCIEKDIVDAKIKAIIREVKNIPCEAVFIFLSHNETAAPFDANTILQTKDEMEALLKRIDEKAQTEAPEVLSAKNNSRDSAANPQNFVAPTDEQQEGQDNFLLSLKTEILVTHIETAIILAQKKNPEELCAVLEEIDYFSDKYPVIKDIFFTDIEKMRSRSKCD
jgi:hypothetical protein